MRRRALLRDEGSASVAELERLGDSQDFSSYLLTVLELNGWRIERIAARGFAGLPVWEARHRRLPDPIHLIGRLDEIAKTLFEHAGAALSLTPVAAPAGDLQLRLY
jgi:hypothetical protein